MLQNAPPPGCGNKQNAFKYLPILEGVWHDALGKQVSLTLALFFF